MSDEAFNNLLPQRIKRGYRTIFFTPPSGRWDLPGSLTDSYYSAARVLIEGAVNGQYFEGVEGIAGVFLFRHYLELGLKYALFHARWLSSWDEIESRENIEGIRNIHLLDTLWNDLKEACKTRIRPDDWSQWDIDFLEKCVQEFHGIDPKSFNFRYGTKKLEVAAESASHQDIKTIFDEKLGVTYALTPDKDLRIDFEALVFVMQHAHDVLEAIDSCLFESHGQIQDWLGEFNNEVW